jgi:hypothetical protein
LGFPVFCQGFSSAFNQTLRGKNQSPTDDVVSPLPQSMCHHSYPLQFPVREFGISS